MKKPCRSCATRSRSTEISNLRNSTSRPPLAALGRLDEARIAAKDGLAMDPTFTIRRYRGDAPSDNPVFLAARQRIYEMMRRVGLPEG
jgi:hypothetical protein